MKRQLGYNPPSSRTFDWFMGISVTLMITGIFQDGWAHSNGLVDQILLAHTPYDRPNRTNRAGAALVVACSSVNRSSEEAEQGGITCFAIARFNSPYMVY
jgi:hypothetical protein